MYSVGDLILIRQDTQGKNSPNPLVDPTDWLMWHANISMVPSWLIWITLTKCSTFGDWFHLNLAKTIEDTICHTTCLTKVCGEHCKFRVTTAHVKIHSLSSPIHITLCNVNICPFLQRMTVYFHATP
jgi:hypothetical protein